MNSNRQPSVLGVIGLILGLIALILSFIECIGTAAFLPGIIGLVLGVISILKSRDDGRPMTLSIVVVVISLIACFMSGFQLYKWGNSLADAKKDLKKYTTCEEVKSDYDRLEKEMARLTQEVENEQSPFGAFREMTRFGIQLEHLRESSDELGCNINFDDFDPESVLEEESKQIENEEKEMGSTDDKEESKLEDKEN